MEPAADSSKTASRRYRHGQSWKLYRWNRWKLQERIQAIPTRAELEPTAIEELDVISKWKPYRHPPTIGQSWKPYRLNLLLTAPRPHHGQSWKPYRLNLLLFV